MESLPFDRHIKEMKTLALHLVKHSFPIANPEKEDVISWMKQREIAIDGYELIVYFSRSHCYDVNLESLQVYGKYFSFLPFSLVCKVAYKFLGNKELSLIEVVHNKQNAKETVIDQYSRKIYVWTVYYDSSGSPIANPFTADQEPQVYDGLRYTTVDRKQITFF